VQKRYELTNPDTLSGMTLIQKPATNTQNTNNWLVDVIKKVNSNAIEPAGGYPLQTTASVSYVKAPDFSVERHVAQ